MFGRILQYNPAGLRTVTITEYRSPTDDLIKLYDEIKEYL